MNQTLRKYHGYLVGLAENSEPVGRSIECQWQMALWMGPLIVGIILCYALDRMFHFDGIRRLIVILPFGIVSMIGGAYVGLLFLRVGMKTDLRRAKEKRASR